MVDYLGSVTGITNKTTGAVSSTFRYKPYGAKLSGGTIGVGFYWTGNTGSRTTGKEYAEQYNRARHYSSVTNQWISRDPLWPRQRSYGYVGGNPIGIVDSLGLQVVRHPGYPFVPDPPVPEPPLPPYPALPWPFDPNGPKPPPNISDILYRVPLGADCIDDDHLLEDLCFYLNPRYPTNACLAAVSVAVAVAQHPDAYRHCVWGCSLTQACGCKVAHLADQKEIRDTRRGAAKSDTNNDFYQNSVGRYLGSKSPEVNCVQECIALASAGLLETPRDFVG